MSTVIIIRRRGSPADVPVSAPATAADDQPSRDRRRAGLPLFRYDPSVSLRLREADGTTRHLTIEKEEGEDLGLNFDSYLMDEPRPCSNHCLFCFVDQMPPNMRDTLYFKDDDAAP